MPDAIPCKICGCKDGEPGLCHAVTPGGKSCWRVQPDWCSACGTWEKEMRARNPLAPLETLCAAHRANRAYEASLKRGANVPGAYALKVHAVRMQRKARQFMVDAGLIKPTEEKALDEKDKPLCPQSF